MRSGCATVPPMRVMPIVGGVARSSIEEEQVDPLAWRRPAKTTHGDGRGSSRRVLLSRVGARAGRGSPRDA
jgi:hypothetical protein